MAVDVLLGLQWGDEGKGKITDMLGETSDIIVRFQGGANAFLRVSSDLKSSTSSAMASSWIRLRW